MMLYMLILLKTTKAASFMLAALNFKLSYQYILHLISESQIHDWRPSFYSFVYLVMRIATVSYNADCGCFQLWKGTNKY